MKQIILDTSFILTCVKNKLDFFEKLELEGVKILIPNQVIKEIEGLSNSKAEAKLALKIIKSKKPKIISIDGKNTDNSIINYARENPDLIVATLDREIKSKIRNSKLVIKNKKKLEII